MKDFFTNHIYILGTIVLTVYGQLIMKWRVGFFGDLPDEITDKFKFIFNVLIDPFILSGLISAFGASIFWMAAMTKFDLSYAYPFMSLNFAFVFVFCFMLFGEEISLYRVVGIILIMLGTILVART